MERAMQGSAVHTMLALRRAVRGRVWRHDARLFTDGGRRLLHEIAEQLPHLVAGGYLEVETAKSSTAGRGVLRVTAAGLGLLAQLEQARLREVQWTRSQRRAADTQFCNRGRLRPVPFGVTVLNR